MRVDNAGTAGAVGVVMGLDVYVGTLTRYYRGEWETVIQQLGMAGGPEVAESRLAQSPRGAAPDYAPAGAAGPSVPTPPPITWLDRIERWLNALSNSPLAARPAPSNRARPVAETVAAWRARLNRELAGQLAQPLDWDESDAAPYFTDKPDWIGYARLVLLAAHDEHPELSRPARATDDWTEDAAWQAASRDDFAHSRYRHLLSPELWLPCDFAPVFSTADVGGQDDVTLGSSVALLAQLRELNQRTCQGSPEGLAEWLAVGPDPAAGPEQTTRFALALFLDLAARSVAHRLPMKLDW